MRYFTVQVHNSQESQAYWTFANGNQIFLSLAAAEAKISQHGLSHRDRERNKRVAEINQQYIADVYIGDRVYVPGQSYLPYDETYFKITERDELWLQGLIWDTGTEERVNPWEDERWFNHYFEDHGLHASEADPKSCTFWDGRRWVSMKPGKYLKKFCENLLTPRQIEFQSKIWVDGRAEGDSEWPTVVKFARTAEEVLWVYDNGPQSCMKGMPGVIAYADSDLAIAYLYDEDEDWVIARALCWPDKKVFGRVYPNDSDYGWRDDGFLSYSDLQDARSHFKTLLRKDGWTSYEEGGPEVFEGARMPLVGLLNGHKNAYAAPYPDHLSSYIDEEAQQLVMASEIPKDKQQVSGNTESYIILRPTVDYFTEKPYYSSRYEADIIAPDGSMVDVMNFHGDHRIFRDPFNYTQHIRHPGLKTVKIIYGRIWNWAYDTQNQTMEALVENVPPGYAWQDHKGRWFQTSYANPVTFNGKVYHPQDPALKAAQTRARKVSPAQQKAAENLKAVVKAKKAPAYVFLTPSRLYANARH